MTDAADNLKDDGNRDADSAEGVPPVKTEIRLTLDKRIDLAIAVAIILFGIFVIIETRNIRPGHIYSAISSRQMPYISGIFLVFCGALIAAIRLVNWSQLPGNLVPGEGHEDEEGFPSSWVRAFAIILSAWLSVWLLKSLGYLIATPLFMMAAFWLMGTRSWIRIIGFAAVYTLATWYVFSQVLEFAMPLGFLTPLFRSWGLTM